MNDVFIHGFMHYMSIMIWVLPALVVPIYYSEVDQHAYSSYKTGTLYFFSHWLQLDRYKRTCKDIEDCSE